MNNDITTPLFREISNLIDRARAGVAYQVNSALVILYWHIGQRIRRDILQEERAEYGEGIVKQLAKELTMHYSTGFDRSNLSRMIRFAELYPNEQIGVTLSHQFSWSHLVRLIAIDDPLKRDFYTEMCRLERWSVRGLRQKIDSMLYERTAIAKLPEPIIKKELEKLRQGDLTTPELYLQDPCVLNFLYPQAISTEQDLESAILSELQNFIQDIGSDFCFIARQKRMSTGKNDRYLDLLFFHRGMHRLVAIELKLVAFQPEHVGQMEWYLKWLDKYERRAGEEKPLGIIMCSDKDQEDVELLELDKNGIHVAQYLTELPPKLLLETKLRKAIEIARERYERACLMKSSPS
jgi:predicted nuclease of restriction endonuclease-like (RecB) superfamily